MIEAAVSSLIVPNTCPNQAEHDHADPYFPMSDALAGIAGGLDS